MGKGALQSTNTYTYDATWKDKLATYSDGDTTYTFTYDEIGNPISYRNGMTMDWDRGRQLSSLTIGNKTVEYEYNADGLRTYKNDSTGYETIYYYDTSNNLIAIDQNSTVCYFYYDSNGEVTSMSFNGTLYFFVKNLQGDVEKIVDRQGIVQVSYTYDEWGNVINIDDDSYYTLSYFNPFLYRSYIYDRETGLYYLQSRYYDPQTGRFLNADILVQYSNHKSNVYTYCKNNPVIRVDENGMASKKLKYPGQIHNKVQKYIAKKYKSVKKEVKIKYKDGKYGRADLVNIDTGGVWEIKPLSTKFKNAVNQLNKYVNGTAKKYPYLKLKVGGSFSGDSFISGDYEIEYWYESNGIVRYDYNEIEDNKVKLTNTDKAIVAGVVCVVIIAGCVIFAPSTGGASLGGLAFA